MLVMKSSIATALEQFTLGGAAPVAPAPSDAAYSAYRCVMRAKIFVVSFRGIFAGVHDGATLRQVSPRTTTCTQALSHNEIINTARSTATAADLRLANKYSQVQQ